jgi:glycosidase
MAEPSWVHHAWKAVWSSLNDANYYELVSALDRHNTLLESFAPLTFVGNHDVTRIASRLHNPDLLPHALFILFTVGGTPSVYYGDEQGYTGIKEDRPGGGDEVRAAFPADFRSATNCSCMSLLPKAGHSWSSSTRRPSLPNSRHRRRRQRYCPETAASSPTTC